MKKLICFLIMVMAVAVVSFNATIKASSVTNKGSTVVMVNTTTMPTGSMIDLTAETTDWVVQQNSSSNLMPLQAGTAVMNNTNKLMGIDDASPLSSKMMIAGNLLIGPNSRIMETGVEVQKIPSFSIISFSSSNTQMSKYDRTQWRQNSIDMMANTTVCDIRNGANVCVIKDGNSYKFVFAGDKSFPHLPVTA